MRFRKYIVSFEDNRADWVGWFFTKRGALRYARAASGYGAVVVMRRGRRGVLHALAFFPCLWRRSSYRVMKHPADRPLRSRVAMSLLSLLPLTAAAGAVMLGWDSPTWVGVLAFAGLVILTAMTAGALLALTADEREKR